MALLEVKNIVKSFGKTEVLKGISFGLERGEVLAIIGSSGSGKTTLLRCLNYLEIPDFGQITVDGKTVFDSSLSFGNNEKEIRNLRLHFGLVFQSFNLFPQYTAFENITLAPKLKVKEAIKNKTLDPNMKNVELLKIEYDAATSDGDVGAEIRVYINDALVHTTSEIYSKATAADDPSAAVTLIMFTPYLGNVWLDNTVLKQVD